MALFTSASRLQLQKLLDLRLQFREDAESRAGKAISDVLVQPMTDIIVSFVRAQTGCSITFHPEWSVLSIETVEDVEECIHEMILGGFDGEQLVREWDSDNEMAYPGGPEFKLYLYDTGKFKEPNHYRMSYRFYHKGELVFWGDDYGCSRCSCVDSDQTVASLLVFLSLRKGDTDQDYFDSYTPAQLEFSEQFGEGLGILAYKLENPEENEEDDEVQP